MRHMRMSNVMEDAMRSPSLYLTFTVLIVFVVGWMWICGDGVGLIVLYAFFSEGIPHCECAGADSVKFV